MERSRLIGFALVLIIALAAATPVAVIATNNEYRGPENSENQEYVEVEVGDTLPKPLRVIVYFNTTLEELVKLAYDVRNVSMPIVNWALKYNVTLGEDIIKRGDRFLERALNESSKNSTRALAHAMVAAIIYSHTPVTAQPVLAKVVRENLGENETVTNTTVQAVYSLTLELRDVLGEAKSIAVSLNYSVPDRVKALEITAEGYLNTSRRLLEEGFVKEAFRAVVKAYHTYVLAYSTLLKSMLTRGLHLGQAEPLTPKLLKREVSREALERIAEKLPKPIRERVRERIRLGDVKDWKGLREAVRAEIEKQKELMNRASIETVAQVMTSLVMYMYASPAVAREARNAISTWLEEEGFTTKAGVFKRVEWQKVREYFRQLAENISRESGVSGLELLSKTIAVFHDLLKQKTGVDIDLQHILTQIVVKIEVKH